MGIIKRCWQSPSPSLLCGASQVNWYISYIPKQQPPAMRTVSFERVDVCVCAKVWCDVWACWWAKMDVSQGTCSFRRWTLGWKGYTRNGEVFTLVLGCEREKPRARNTEEQLESTMSGVSAGCARWGPGMAGIHNYQHFCGAVLSCNTNMKVNSKFTVIHSCSTKDSDNKSEQWFSKRQTMDWNCIDKMKAWQG